MSLVLEALRKLEREKRTPERGLVVTGASDWARAEDHPGRRLAWGLAAAVGLAAAFFVWRGSTAHAPATGPATATTAGSAVAPVAAPAAATTATAAAPPSVTAGAHPPAREPLSPVAAPLPAVTARAVAAPPATAPADDADGAAEAGLETGPDQVAPDAPAQASRSDAPAAAPGEVVLQAVTERDGRPLAIVNGRLVREGDAFDGIRILRIGAAEIEVEVGGRRRTVGF